MSAGTDVYNSQNEWHRCEAAGCGKIMVPRYAESCESYARRRSCNRDCMTRLPKKPPASIELHQCSNPDCTNAVPYRDGMKPSEYWKRKSCSRACELAVRRLAGIRSHQGRPRVERPAALQKPKPAASPKEEAEAIAAYLQTRGVTACPTKPRQPKAA